MEVAGAANKDRAARPCPVPTRLTSQPALAPLLVPFPFPQSITKTRRRMYRLQSCTGTPPLVIELAGSQGTLQLPSRIRKELATSSSFAPLLPPVRSKLATSELVSFLLCSSSSSPVGCAMATALALAAAVLLLSSTLAASEFCVCRPDQPTTAQQKVIDFSCGDGADCSSILQGGGCYNPNTVAAHCSWAANSYYQNNKAKGATCDFGGAAAISTTDPSFSGCTFPSTARTITHNTTRYILVAGVRA
ncbi:hypothetical protein PVAP13_9NG527100 [Panicum virgatum]|uniref:X8 domain-containing protein n=1 Tax=Panicum virgatum TaxID=38727 RepID=A0A8T0MRF8_PANVG|nr:hypothetical protein PVAP13_9NG527100 [Panicum virgatum]